MPARRVIPCLDVKDGRVVKGTRFVDIRDAGDPVELAARYDREGADELVFLDITASAERRRTVIDLAQQVAATLTIPFCVGGGIGSVDLAAAILRAGADKVAVNTAAVRRPALLGEIAARAGSQAAVLAIDAKRRDDGSYEVYVEGGRTPTGLDAVEWARRGVRGRRGRDPSHVDGSRRHARRIRARTHRARRRSGARAGDRIRRRGHGRALRRSVPAHRSGGGARGVDLPLRRDGGGGVEGGARASRRRRSAERRGGMTDEIRFDERGLVPAIVQDAATGAVLMLAYMDREALDATLRTREVHFHSRSRGRLWHKGETSGNVLHLVDLVPDCDADAVLVKVHPAGPACHTGEATCFGPVNAQDLGRFLSELAAMLRQRRRDLPAGSYSASCSKPDPTRSRRSSWRRRARPRRRCAARDASERSAS